MVPKNALKRGHVAINEEIGNKRRDASTKRSKEAQLLLL